MRPQDFTLIYILGAGHCGSTLLNLLLNGHSQALGLSEVSRIGRHASSIGQSEEPSLNSVFWRAVAKCYESVSGQSFTEIDISNPSWEMVRNWGTERIIHYAQTNGYFLSCVAKESEASFLVDASKRWQRLHVLKESGLFAPKVIHLLRDGRGVVNSFLRKGIPFGPALRRWAAPALAAFFLRPRFSESEWLQIRYEQLARFPEDTLRSICAFLDTDFEPEMLAYRQHPDLGIGGNRMRRREDERIFLDERWKQELSRSDRLKFALVGGWLNRIYGY